MYGIDNWFHASCGVKEIESSGAPPLFISGEQLQSIALERFVISASFSVFLLSIVACLISDVSMKCYFT